VLFSTTRFLEASDIVTLLYVFGYGKFFHFSQVLWFELCDCECFLFR